MNLPQGYEPHEIPPDYTGPLFLESQMQAVIEAEREACAVDAEWCIQNHLEHLLPERIRARGKV